MPNPNIKYYGFKKGYDPRRHIKKKGEASFKTMFFEACKQVYKDRKKHKKPDKLIIEIIKTGLEKLLNSEKFDYSLYKDIMDRIFGKAPETIEIEAKKKLITLDEEENFTQTVTEQLPQENKQLEAPKENIETVPIINLTQQEDSQKNNSFPEKS
jgi:hypothetical protein